MDILRSYDNVSELLAAVHAPCANPANKQHLNYAGGGGWICADRRSISSYGGAWRALEEPLFPAGVARVEKARAQIEIPTPVSIRRKVRRDDHGDELDMSRVWQGDLEHAWTHAKRQRVVSASRVLVGVFIAALADIGAAELAWRGVAGIALADALEQAGYTVCVRAMCSSDLMLASGASGYKQEIEVTVKAESMPLDIHKAASLIASPLLFRGVFLPHALVQSKLALTAGATATREHCYTRAKMQDANHFDFACIASKEITDARSATRWVTEQISKLEALNQPA